ncbi:MAG: ATP-binding protein, partial [Verrucomicrobiota bacterium]
NKILRVVECLMDNAVKFTASGFVRLSAHLVQSAERDWRFVASIADSGPGIPADQLHDLFEPFGTLDSSNTRTTRGLGLGLAICQRIGRAIGGELKVDSTPGKGSTFHFSCPVYPKQ